MRFDKGIVLNVAEQFTQTPGARYRRDGGFSGEEFREKFLEPLFLIREESKSQVTVVLDGTCGYSTGFLDEAFGGLARKFGRDVVLARLKFISEEEPLLPEEIEEYIREAAN